MNPQARFLPPLGFAPASRPGQSTQTRVERQGCRSTRAVPGSRRREHLDQAAGRADREALVIG